MLISADLHIGLNSDNPPGTVGLPLKCIDTRTRMFELLDVAVSKSVPLVIAGDIFDKENPTAYAHDLFSEFLDRVQLRGVPLYIIPGNHDCGATWSALMVSHRTHDCPPSEIKIIMDVPYVITYNGMTVCFIPHLPKKQYAAVIAEFGTVRNFVYARTGQKSFDVLITHAHVDGAVSASETELMESGTAYNFVDVDWPAFKLGVFGHVHRHQQISIKKTATVVFPGSVIMNDYGERNDEKGFISVKKDGKLPVWTFMKFTSTVTRYKQIKIDLLTKSVFKTTDVQLKKLCGYLLKIVVHTDDLAKVDEVSIRKVFNKYSYVVRFERVLYLADRVGIDTNVADVIFSGIAYDKLLQGWLDKKTEVQTDIRRLALKIGKEVLGNA